MIQDTDTPALTPDQRRRYARTIQLPDVGIGGQRRLMRSTVLIVGAGALGSTAAMYLAASGVGTLRIIDYDTVDISNLQRQLTYIVDDLGKPKTACLARRIAALNPDVKVEITDGILTADTVGTLIDGADIVIEASDNPATKYLVTDAAHAAGIPCILGAVGPDASQLLVQMPDKKRCESVKYQSDRDHQSIVGNGRESLYRRLFPEAPGTGVTPCSLGGLLGPLPGVIATMQALRAITLLLNPDAPSLLLTLDPRTLATHTIPLG